MSSLFNETYLNKDMLSKYTYIFLLNLFKVIIIPLVTDQCILVYEKIYLFIHLSFSLIIIISPELVGTLSKHTYIYIILYKNGWM